MATALTEWVALGDLLTAIAQKPSDADKPADLAKLSGGLRHLRELAREVRPLSLRLRE
jgi:hypothetical protein